MTLKLVIQLYRCDIWNVHELFFPGYQRTGRCKFSTTAALLLWNCLMGQPSCVVKSTEESITSRVCSADVARWGWTKICLFGQFGSPLAPIRSPFSLLVLKNAWSHHLMWTIWLFVITQTSFNESHASLLVKLSSVIKNIQMLQYYGQQKSFVFQWTTLFRSICQIYAFWVPIPAA